MRIKTILGLLLLATLAGAQTWDPTKPATSGALVSADIRSNWYALGEAVAGVNLAADPTFIIWPEGDSAEPAHWTLSGTGATISRGTSVTKFSGMAPAVTSGAGATGVLTQELLDTGVFQASFQGTTVSCGAWLRGAGASVIRFGIYDGVGTSYSDYGDNGSWSWETVTRTLDASADRIDVEAEVASGTNTGYVDGVTCVLGPVPPERFHPAPVRYESRLLWLEGDASVATNQRQLVGERPFIVKQVFLQSIVAVTGADLIVDVNQWSGAAWVSMFQSGSRPTITAGTSRGSSEPDSATYSTRCFNGNDAASATLGDLLNIDIDQVGSSTAGHDLHIWVRALSFDRPLEVFLDVADHK